MKLIPFRICCIIIVLISLTSCGSGNSSSQGQQGQQGQGYKDTKTMVIDVLKTTEGQQAIMDAGKGSQDKSIKLLATGQGQQIQIAVKEILTADTGKKILEQTMIDPKFAGQFATAIQSNIKQIHQDLMKDPQYQKSMLELMNNPEFQKIVTTTMKSTVYRQQMMNVIQESMQSPLFKMQLLELLKKVVVDGVTPKIDGGSTGGGGGGGSSGGGGGGGSQQSSSSSDSQPQDSGSDASPSQSPGKDKNKKDNSSGSDS